MQFALAFMLVLLSWPLQQHSHDNDTFHSMQYVLHILLPRPMMTQIGPYLMRFLEVMRGTRTAAPTKLLPVMKMPLKKKKKLLPVMKMPLSHHHHDACMCLNGKLRETQGVMIMSQAG